MDSFTIRSLDRISMLPDSILCHILSFLPMKYAVRTSTLSTRYQYLWTYITSLHFDNSELFTNDIGEAEADLSFRNFVSTVLLLSNASCLEKFSLKLESFCNIGIVKSWISIAIKRNIQKLELGYSQCGEIPIQLPRTMFICKTLVDLTLKGMVSLQIPASVWLPSLKILKMEDVIYENGDSAQKLIHGCPVLEYLDFYREDAENGEVLNIYVPTLKRLEVTCLGPGEQLVFNNPTLEYLDVTYYWAEGFSLVNLSSLLEARIDIELSGSRPINSANILKLLHGIANVKFLWMCYVCSSVSTVLLLSNASCLEKFSLKLESFCNIGIVKSWISIAIKRNIQKLELGYSQLCGEIPIQLPRTMFICKTLVDLTLKGMVSLQIPASVWLPSLKILKMEDVIYENGDSAQKLIHGCPVLEYLDFYREDAENGEVLNIYVPTLKRLEVTCLGPGEQLVFNNPTLEYLDVTYYWAEGISLVNLSSLLEARIDIELSGSRPINSANILKLLHGIANVKFLWMCYVCSSVSTVLLLSNASCLEKFSLKLESFCNIGIVKSWISIAIKRNIQKLELGYSQLCGEIPIQLPRTMFICKTLVDLTLKGMVFLQIPASVWLPSLKILKMEDVIYENGDSAQKLIHGCPVLEYLDFYREDAENGEVLNIYVPTLKRLEVTCLGPGEQLVFNTPTLEYLDLTYYWAEGFSLVNLSSLLEARIDIELSGSRPINSANILKLLHGIANVKFLWFHADITDYVPITFHTLQNLTHLRLLCGFNCNGFNLNFLNDFLVCAPNLEVLVLEKNRFSSTKSWSPPLRVPHCLLFNLKEVEFLYLRRKNQEFEVIEYLLRNAEVLKKMTVDCQHSDIWRIAQFPRASKTCILNLL